jgi:hypothetical protein
VRIVVTVPVVAEDMLVLPQDRDAAVVGAKHEPVETPECHAALSAAAARIATAIEAQFPGNILGALDPSGLLRRHCGIR